jgi:RNA polymerase sigma factor (sigma-70 family)
MDTPSVDPRTTMSVEALYRSHAAEIFRYAYAMLGNRADAEDVTQATFVNAMRAIERHGEPHTPSNWLITIAHNVVRQRFRQQQARPTEVELESELEARELEAGETSIDDLVRALQRIPPNQREALVMRELEGRPYREIAAMLDLSLSAVETLIFRARRSLAEELEHLVTCDRAELALSRRRDGGMSRKERRRLEEHLRECAACAELAARQTGFQDAFRRLALLPAPASLPFGGGGSGAVLATGAATVGTGAAAVGAGSTVAAGGTAALVGGAAAKLAVAAAAIATAGGVGYTVEQAHHAQPAQPPAAKAPAVVHASTAAPRAGSHARATVTRRTKTSVASVPTVTRTPPVAAAEPPAATEHRSDRAQAVQQARADAATTASQGSSASSSRSAQGSEHSASAPGQVKKVETTPGTADTTPQAVKAPGTPNANANAAASRPKGEPAANAGAAHAAAPGQSKTQTASDVPTATTTATPPPTTTTATTASGPPATTPAGTAPPGQAKKG